MNRRSILALLAAFTVSGAICAAVPKIVGPPATQRAAISTADTQPSTANGAAAAPASHPHQTAASTMPTAVDHLREQAEQTHGVMLYIMLGTFLLISGLGLPIPEEIPLMLGGYKAWHGAANLYILIPIGLVCVLTADIMLFLAAKYWRTHLFRLRLMRAMIRPRHLEAARKLFHNHGMKIVIVARWLPALRTAVCLTAGLTGVNAWNFLLVDATAACITVPTGVFMGYFAANQIDRIIAVFQRAEHTVVIVVLLALTAAAIYWIGWGRHRFGHHEGEDILHPLDNEAELEKIAELASHELDPKQEQVTGDR